jgi:hypothetical protein
MEGSGVNRCDSCGAPEADVWVQFVRKGKPIVDPLLLCKNCVNLMITSLKVLGVTGLI